MTTPIFGAYIHFRPDGRIFYVGKGKEARALDLHPRQRRNDHHANIVAKDGAENIHISFFPCKSEEAAFALEIAMISRFRKMGELLVNRTGGGEGCSGYIWSDESRAKMSAVNMGKILSEETKVKIGAAKKGNQYSKGREHTKEELVKMSTSQKGRIFTEEHKAKLTAAAYKRRAK